MHPSEIFESQVGQRVCDRRDVPAPISVDKRLRQ